MLQRFKVLGIGLLLGGVFALFVAGPMMPSGMDLHGRVFAWVTVMSGPILGTAWGMNDFHSPIGLGWLGLFLIPAHPLRPNTATGCVTNFGLILWFFAGFLTIGESVWGA